MTEMLKDRQRRVAAAKLSRWQNEVLLAVGSASSAAEAARRLGIKPSALKMVRSRARAKLAKAGIRLADGRSTAGRGRHRTYAGLPAGI